MDKTFLEYQKEQKNQIAPPTPNKFIVFLRKMYYFIRIHCLNM